jgi:hypothetical protein
MPIETKRALIVVRTYPTPAKQGIEVSCTAAITDKGEWLRLFPVPYRFLSPDQRFRKYQWVDVTVSKAAKDHRAESYKIENSGIQIVSEPLPVARAWQARKDIVLPMAVSFQKDGTPGFQNLSPQSCPDCVTAFSLA